jgi:hypothetical protein
MQKTGRLPGYDSRDPQRNRPPQLGAPILPQLRLEDTRKYVSSRLLYDGGKLGALHYRFSDITASADDLTFRELFRLHSQPFTI